MQIKNPIYNEFLKLGLIKKKNITKICNQTRDKRIGVFKDKKTSIIFLEKFSANSNYWHSLEKIDKKSKKENTIYTNLLGGKTVKSKSLDDHQRRFLVFKKYFKNKTILDFGCSWGDLLVKLRNYSRSCSGIEVKQHCINYIKRNYKFISIQNKLDNFNSNFDIITLFHVLEHIPYQVETLKKLRKKLSRNGKIIIEVPHAQDFLILTKDLPEFKKFTFWSEHIVLHTENSLRKVLNSAGFKKVKIEFFQRYGLTNHLGWFLKKKPGGQQFYKKYEDKNLDMIYKQNLRELGQTDTLVAIANK